MHMALKSYNNTTWSEGTRKKAVCTFANSDIAGMIDTETGDRFAIIIDRAYKHLHTPVKNRAYVIMWKQGGPHGAFWRIVEEAA